MQILIRYQSLFGTPSYPQGHCLINLESTLREDAMFLRVKIFMNAELKPIEFCFKKLEITIHI